MTLRWGAPSHFQPGEHPGDLIAWAGSYVAVGSVQTESGGQRAAAWFSRDWRTWERTLLDGSAQERSGILSVLAFGSTLYGVGTSGIEHCTRPGEGQTCDPLPVAIWKSSDGHAWKRLAVPAELSGVTITAAAAGPSGLVLAGGIGWNEPRIWLSRDGANWEREILDPGVFAKPHFAALRETRAGLILTGFTGGAEPRCCVGGSGDTLPAAWLSTDGRTWVAARVANLSHHVGDAILDVFEGRDGLAAWGNNGSTGWTSADGHDWSQRFAATESGSLVPAASDGQRIYGTSYVDRDHLGIWASREGKLWNAMGDTGAVDQKPGWPGAPTMVDAMFPFADGIGMWGQDLTGSAAAWFAEGVASH